MEVVERLVLMLDYNIQNAVQLQDIVMLTETQFS